MVEAILEPYATGLHSVSTPNLTLLVPSLLGSWLKVGNAIGRPMLGLGSPSLGHRIA